MPRAGPRLHQLIAWSVLEMGAFAQGVVERDWACEQCLDPLPSIAVG